MNTLLSVNVNDKTEKKGQLTYLSWAFAWAECLKADPQATWVVHTYGPQGNEQPCMWVGETAMVHTSVTVNGIRRECLLPVMDNKNNAVKNPDSRKISDAIMRCMVKAISMHGLGLYLYAGEDVPESFDTKPEPKPEPKHATISATAEAWKELDEDTQRNLRRIALEVTAAMPDGDAALDILAFADLSNEHKAGLWHLLDSATRSALKKANERVAA